MLKIEATVQPCMLEEVHAALKVIGVSRIMVHQVTEHDGKAKAYYRGCEYPAGIPRVKIEILSNEEQGDEVVSALMHAARTQGADDGIILIYEVADAIRIHTGARLQYAHS